MIKKNWVYILFGFSVLAYITSELVFKKQSQQIEVKSISTSNGWGYEIYVGKKVYISQKTIPAVAGTKGFVSEKEALEVGNFVVSKMNKQQKLPSVNLKELDSLGIKRR
jgi:hypothetical protein